MPENIGIIFPTKNEALEKASTCKGINISNTTIILPMPKQPIGGRIKYPEELPGHRERVTPNANQGVTTNPALSSSNFKIFIMFEKFLIVFFV